MDIFHAYSLFYKEGLTKNKIHPFVLAPDYELLFPFLQSL